MRITTKATNKERNFLSNRIKTGYIFTISFSIYWFISLIIALLLPWDSNLNFFEIIETNSSYSLFFLFGIFTLYVILITITVLTLVKLWKISNGKLNSKGFFCPLSTAWLLLMIIYILTIVIIAFSTIGGSFSGVGRTTFNYIFMGSIYNIFNFEFLHSFGFFFMIFITFFPIIMFVLGSKKDIEIEKKRHETTNKQVIGWISLMSLIVGVFSTIIISLILPWSMSENFFVFLISQFNIQSILLLFSVLVGIILMGYILIMSFSLFFKIKPWNNFSKLIKEENALFEKRILTDQINKSLICWNGIWISLSISIINGLILLQGGIILPSSGILLYFTSAYLIVIISIILNMILVCFYGRYRVLQIDH